MGIRAGLICGLLFLVPLPAMAQPLFANPLDTASGYRAARGETPDATHTFRYEIIRVGASDTPVVSEAALAVASDWALFRNGDDAVLYDFKLNRQFALKGDTFTTTNGMADLMFRVMERQNRAYLGQILSTVDAGDMMSDCDSDAELGLSMPQRPSKGVIAVTDVQGGQAVSCNGKAMGSFAAGTEPAPEAFWPTLFNALPMHPALFKRLRESGAAPSSLEIMRSFGNTQDKSVLKLLSSESTSTPYPLTEAMRNATADEFDTLLGPGMAQLATSAIAGHAAGGPPTLQSWNAHIAALASADPGAAAMLVMASFNMFPEALGQCGGQAKAICDVARSISTLAASDPAPMALMEMIVAEQEGNTDDGIRAMQVIQNSRHRDHPVASGSFALSLLKFKPADVAKAKAAGLTTDARAHQARAIEGLPYNPAYWTDAGDVHAASYQWRNAALFYDVAFALPMPSAVASNDALANKRSMFEMVRRDFPEAFLPR